MNAIRPLTARDSMSPEVRVLEVVRRYFRATGRSPSYREIAVRASVTVGKVGRLLDRLAAQNYLHRVPGVKCSIVMVDRTANLSDTELEAGCHGRNWTIVKPPPILASLGAAFPVNEGGTDLPADFAALLDHLDATAPPDAGQRTSRDGKAQAEVDVDS